MVRWIAVAGVLLCGTAVALGAFGAHWLKDALPTWYDDAEIVQKRLDNWETAVHYQLAHGLALLALGLTGSLANSRLARAGGTALLIGCAIFSGSLYGLVLSGQTVLGAVVPLGGLSFLVGWLLLGIACLRRSSTTREET